MRRHHFERLRPVCPLCRLNGGAEHPLTIAAVVVESDGGIREGLLRCASPACLMEYPIIDGIPIVVSNVRSYVSDNLAQVTSRGDLSPLIESVVGDAVGPGTSFDTTRHHLSTYCWDHYGDLGPDDGADADRAEQPRAGEVVRCLSKGLELLADPPGSPAIDLGCSVGRATFELADRTDGLVLGVDTNFAMLRVAQEALRDGVVRYPLRRVGIVYDRQEREARFPAADRVDFWVCDCMALPFRPGTFRTAVALQLLDCTPSPHEMLQQLRRVLADGGDALFATPYDWSAGATPVEAWIGGHSQRGEGRGASEPLLRALLTPDAHPQSIAGFELIGEVTDFPWSVRLHARSTMQYRTHILAARAAE